MLFLFYFIFLVILPQALLLSVNPHLTLSASVGIQSKKTLAFMCKCQLCQEALNSFGLAGAEFLTQSEVYLMQSQKLLEKNKILTKIAGFRRQRVHKRLSYLRLVFIQKWYGFLLGSGLGADCHGWALTPWLFNSNRAVEGSLKVLPLSQLGQEWKDSYSISPSECRCVIFESRLRLQLKA